MPEYLAPGVYVEEVSFRAKSIEGVGTSTTAFVGPTRRGPVGAAQGAPELVTSLTDFERLYGGLTDLALSGVTDPALRLNFLAHAVRAYFDNGGSRLYVVRTANGAAAASAQLRIGLDPNPPNNPLASEDVWVRARFPGAAGNGSFQIHEVAQPATAVTLGTAPDGSLAMVGATLHLKTAGAWADAAANALAVTPATVGSLLTLSVEASDADGQVQSWEGLGYGPAHPRYIGTVLGLNPAARAEALANLVWLDVGSTVNSFDLRSAVVVGLATSRTLAMTGGSDGSAPILGAEGVAGSYADALLQLVGLEDVSIVAAPGSSAYAAAQAVQGALIAHAERRRAYRIAVLDCPARQTPVQMREARGHIDSRYAALYYPWVVVANPLARPGRDDIPGEITLPPSGFVCGIYARNDTQRGVHKAPANEVVTGALRFEVDVNFAQQELLNPVGVNCLRYLSGRGLRLWGARLASSDPEWKYVSDRRYFNYLESSIDRGTQWAVFEPNGQRLWANVRQTIADFLYNEWRGGALLGSTVEEAFFVRCDRSTMTQNDLDNGRLICLIGVAILKPAEFVIFRIGQKTADARA